MLTLEIFEGCVQFDAFFWKTRTNCSTAVTDDTRQTELFDVIKFTMLATLRQSVDHHRPAAALRTLRSVYSQHSLLKFVLCRSHT